jgi:hypothetical protein
MEVGAIIQTQDFAEKRKLECHFFSKIEPATSIFVDHEG